MANRRTVLLGTLSASLALAPIGSVIAAAPYKVAIAMPGTISDKGWSESAYTALKKAKAELGIEFSYSEKVEQPDQVEVLSDYARKGYNLIIGHGGEYQDAIERVAKDFPNTKFVVNNGVKAGGNVANVDFYFSQLGYLMGYTAAKVSKTKTVGVLVAEEFKFTLDSTAGFRAGAEAAVPGTKVLYSVMGDWNDVAKGKEAALGQISQGADVLWPTMDAANVGALQAVKEKGAKAIGLYYDAIKDWPDIMIQSAILDETANMLNYLRLAVKGNLESKLYKADVTNPEIMRIGSFGPSVSKDIQIEVLALVEKMKKGELKVEPY
jgi:basic membrane protein A and related proteins